MNRIQLIDLDMSSEEEEMGGVIISRKVMQSRLGWLSTVIESHMKQETKTTQMVEDIQEVHKEEQVQATQEDQPSHALISTDTLEIMDVVKNEYIETSKQQKDMVENPTEIEVTESIKDEYVETGEEQKDVIEKPAELEVADAVKDEKEEMSKQQDNIIQKREVMQLAAV